MEELGLNKIHTQLALNFIKFCRYKRIQRLKSVDLCFQDLKDSRLYEETYTQDEVNEMMDGLLTVVRGEMESELVNSNHMGILLLRQILGQAEKWHLNLAADMSQLENRSLLEKVAQFEEQQASSGRGPPDYTTIKLTDADLKGGVGLLQKEIARLQAENQYMEKRSAELEGHLNAFMKDNNALKEQIAKLGAKPVATMSDEAEAARVQAQLRKLEVDSQTHLDTKSFENEKLAAELTETMHKLLKSQEQLDFTEKQLDKKFRETGAYKNLREMLANKNEQLKDLRKRLAKFETEGQN